METGDSSQSEESALSRFYAASILKNYWRNNWFRTDPPPSKDEVHGRLVALLADPNREVVNQVVDLIALLAWFDCPNDWPGVLDSLFASLHSGSPIHVQINSMSAARQVLKILKSRKRPLQRSWLETLGPQLFSFLFGQWNELIRLLLQQPSEEGGRLTLLIQRMWQLLMSQGLVELEMEYAKVCPWLTRSKLWRRLLKSFIFERRLA